ncbi:AraC family transcriptional regulator [Tistrella mobilis]
MSTGSPSRKAQDGGFRVLPVAMPGLQAVTAETTRRFARHTHDQFGIGVIARGAQGSASGRGPVEAGPGDVITVNPGEVHDGWPIGDAGRAWRMLYIDPPVLAEAAADLMRPGDAEFHHPAATAPATAARFLAAFHSLTAGAMGPAAPLARQERLTVLLADLLGGLLVPAGRPTIPPGIARARAAIDDDPAAAHDLAGLAAIAETGRFQLIRSFTRATGFTPHAYVLERRVQLARRLITTGTPLAEAAAAAGFADQSHMTRHMTRRLGATPGVWAGGSGERGPHR